jgi:simple sugar transport system permease protein
MKNIFKSYEFFLFALLVIISLMIGFINPAFFSWGTLFDVIRIQTVMMVMALGLLPVFIFGGIDVSFVAIGALATYPLHVYLLEHDYTGGAWLYFAVAMLIGLAVGLVEGFLVNNFKLQIFDMSLGMNMLIYGAILFFVGSFDNYTMTPALLGWNSKFLVTVKTAGGIESGLHVAIFIVIAVALALQLILKHTTVGRAIYAYGNDRSVAIRTGFNIKLVTVIVFALLGIIAGLGGITFSAISVGFYPNLMQKRTMEIIAAVILGGASIKGGRGSVVGTILGALLVGLINQALVYLGIDTQWFDFIIGAVFVLYATFQAFSLKVQSKQ